MSSSRSEMAAGSPLPRRPFGATGHSSSAVIFGGNGLKNVSQAEADRTLETLLDFGVNHVDTAARYGASELRIAPWLRRYPGRLFVATKTSERGYAGAREEIQRSCERLGTPCLDLVQLHNLVEREGWELAMGPRGALRALVEARDEGIVRFIGVTGHGPDVARMHLRSLKQFEFDSVLLPYSYAAMRDDDYRDAFTALGRTCAARGVAVQTIKWAARRRWPREPAGRRTWYEPLRHSAALARALHYVLKEPTFFAVAAADLTLLRPTLEAAVAFDGPPSEEELSADADRLEVETLFPPDFVDPFFETRPAGGDSR